MNSLLMWVKEGEDVYNLVDVEATLSQEQFTEKMAKALTDHEFFVWCDLLCEGMVVEHMNEMSKYNITEPENKTFDDYVAEIKAWIVEIS